jgi:Phospholipase B
MQELQAGLLTVVEQVPGLTVSGDETGQLERGYWPSYNVPYFPEVTALWVSLCTLPPDVDCFAESCRL